MPWGPAHSACWKRCDGCRKRAALILPHHPPQPAEPIAQRRNHGLRDCLVVEDQPPGEDLYLSLAQGSAAWLKEHMQSGVRIGLGLGRTLSYLPRAFEMEKQTECFFTEVNGAVSDHSWGFETNNIASQMAEIFGGKAELFYAPTLVSTPELKKQLVKEKSIKEALNRARNCDIVLQSVGPVDQSAILFIQGYLTQADLDQLEKAGAVGDALGHFYNQDGRIIPGPTNELMIGLHPDELRDLPWSVLIAGGTEKVDAIRGALRGGYFNVLITNQKNARELSTKD